jgi:predicted DNA-binding transcriptional regulator AlpA
VNVDSQAPPTLDEIRRWPATVPVPRAATAAGISKAHGYELIKTDQFPFKVLRLGGRYVVVTASIIEVLSGGAAA